MKFQPHDYQAQCIDRLVNEEAVGLFLRPGLGKTVITLTAIHELKYHRFAVRRCLVIAPRTVADATWSTEAAKWDHLRDLRVAPVLGTAAARRRALEQPADVYVINRENVAWLVEHCGKHWPFDMVVLDESTSFKNPSSKRFKALRRMRRFVRRMVLLTGTPSPRGLMDLWAQIYLLDGGQRLGATLTGYRERYFEPDRRSRNQIFSWRPKEGAETAILKQIEDLCITMRAEDYLTLPAVVQDEIPVRLDPRAAAAYRRFERDLLLPVDDAVLTAGTAAVLASKLLQFCNGAVYDEEGRVVPVHDAKLDAFDELLERLDGEPVLVFYGFRHDLDRLQERLSRRRGGSLRVRVYQGAEDAAAWNRREVDVLLAHPASCAYGLNLQQGGHHVVWFGLNWSFELNDQGNCRLWRQGSPYDRVVVHYLTVQGGQDEAVMEVIRGRAGTHEAVMDALRARIRAVKADFPE